ncbi:MAG TPA: hypothetical protein VMB48_03780 [Steroidobacteraceae bacterium]|nr:hypothetical protein [Steroidobacteraceae bacterium]
MADFPTPQPGLVVSYSYLWSEEAERGMVEGRKDRPCAIVIALDIAGDPPRKQVAVVPVTHSPQNPDVAIEIPPRVKQHLRLDGERSLAVLDEMNRHLSTRLHPFSHPCAHHWKTAHIAQSRHDP